MLSGRLLHAFGINTASQGMAVCWRACVLVCVWLSKAVWTELPEDLTSVSSDWHDLTTLSKPSANTHMCMRLNTHPWSFSSPLCFSVVSVTLSVGVCLCSWCQSFEIHDRAVSWDYSLRTNDPPPRKHAQTNVSSSGSLMILRRRMTARNDTERCEFNQSATWWVMEGQSAGHHTWAKTEPAVAVHQHSVHVCEEEEVPGVSWSDLLEMFAWRY